MLIFCYGNSRKETSKARCQGLWIATLRRKAIWLACSCVVGCGPSGLALMKEGIAAALDACFAFCRTLGWVKLFPGAVTKF